MVGWGGRGEGEGLSEICLHTLIPYRFMGEISKGGQSANKFRKSQNRKCADLNYLLDLRTFRKCGMHYVDL